MNDEASFTRAMQEHPKDNSLRLMFADWLEERGDPRGEFIRVQCELAKMSQVDSRKDEFAAREQELLRVHGRNWVEQLVLDPELITLDAFRRGFIEEVDTHAQPFLDHAEEWFRLTPLRHVTVNGYQGNFLGERNAQTIASWAGMSRLLSLRLPENQLGDGGVTALAACPLLARLRILDVGNNHVSEVGAVALATSPFLAELTKLYLDYNDIGVVGANALPRSLFLTKLALLDVGDNFFGAEEGEDEAMEALEARFGDRVRF